MDNDRPDCWMPGLHFVKPTYSMPRRDDMPSSNYNFKNNYKAQREQLGLTIKQVAFKAGIDPASYFNVENEILEPSEDVRARIENALTCDDLNEYTDRRNGWFLYKDSHEIYQIRLDSIQTVKYSNGVLTIMSGSLFLFYKEMSLEKAKKIIEKIVKK